MAINKAYSRARVFYNKVLRDSKKGLATEEEMAVARATLRAASVYQKRDNPEKAKRMSEQATEWAKKNPDRRKRNLTRYYLNSLLKNGILVEIEPGIYKKAEAQE